LSGLGPQKDLESVGLRVVKDLPAVGRNLTAARFSPLAWRTPEPTLSQMMGSPISSSQFQAVPAAYGSAVMEATARVRSAAGARADPSAKRADIVLSFMPLFYAPKKAPMQYSLQGEEWPLKTNAFSILATLGETKAQGTVTFPSGSPDVSPVVTHHAMTDPEDLARATEAVELARKIGGSSDFTRGAEAVDNGAGAPDMWTAVYDGRGTCRMGTHPNDSVVDQKLRVHGISGLRIVDGSVIPVASPYLAVPEVLALAERASDLILDGEVTPGSPAAAVSLFGVSEATVTIPDLSDKLGGKFSMMQAVVYLAEGKTEGLSATPLIGTGSPAASARCILAMGLSGCVLLAASLAVVRRRRDGDDSSNRYTVLLA